VLTLPTAGAVVVVVDCVALDDSDDMPCANATLVIMANAAAPANKCFVMA
jgi:hypothetical protein